MLKSSDDAIARGYRLAQGKWPEKLDDLIPKYLARVPTDPFSGEPLLYRRLEDGVVLYSVGLNGRDDEGISIRYGPGLMEPLDVVELPTLVLLVDRGPVARISGRASAPQIERMLAEHLPSNPNSSLAA